MDDRKLVIRVASGPERGRMFFVGSGVVVGRGTDCDIVLDSGCVSRSHLRITPDKAGGATIEDLGSSNGTFVGDVRIEHRKIPANQSFVVGDVRLFLAYATAEELVELEARATQPEAMLLMAQHQRAHTDDEETVPVESDPAATSPPMPIEATGPHPRSET